MILLGRLQLRRIIKLAEAFFDRGGALAAIEFLTVMGEHTFGGTRTASYSRIDLRRIDRIAHAVNHGAEILHLRMSVNSIANELQMRL